MKTFLTIALAVVLTASLLTGCGCTNRNVETTPEPTVLPTNEEIWNTTETTLSPSTSMTDPTDHTTRETIDSTMETENNTRSTTDTTPTDDTMASRSRRMMPDMR